MSIEVMSPGLLTTIQDLGRFGYQKHGVIVSGAMDPMSFRIANLLVGNRENEAALEVTLTGPKLHFKEHSLIAICGGDFEVRINHEPVPLWRPIWVREGSILQFGKLKDGCRSYLAVHGGFHVTQLLGSRSTYLRAGFGGYQGRALRKGDILHTNTPTLSDEKWVQGVVGISNETMFRTVPWVINKQALALSANSEASIRMIRGPQYDAFTPDSQAMLATQRFRITPQSERMGYRISGPILKLKERVEMISEPVCFGTIQVPPNGEPIILLADRQTTGGYPIIGYVASVDFPILAQLKPGDQLHFEEITVRQAQQLMIEREKAVKVIKLALEQFWEGR